MNSRRKLIVPLVLFIAIAINLQAQSVQSGLSNDDKLFFASPFVVDPFPKIPVFGMPSDSLYNYRGFLDISLFKPQRTVQVDSNWQYITIIEEINGRQLRLSTWQRCQGPGPSLICKH